VLACGRSVASVAATTEQLKHEEVQAAELESSPSDVLRGLCSAHGVSGVITVPENLVPVDKIAAFLDANPGFDVNRYEVDCSTVTCRSSLHRLTSGSPSFFALGQDPIISAEVQTLPIDFNPCSGSTLAPHVELAMLAGDVHAGLELKASVLKGIGWSRATLAIDPTGAADEPDFMQAYRKGCKGGRCAICTVSFSGTDEAKAVDQAMDLIPASFCGYEKVLKGYVGEMRGFYGSPQWKKIIVETSGENCCRTYAAGHSLGGSLANMFAACANQKVHDEADKPHFEGSSNDVNLVTFAPAALSVAPFYNGEPNKAFKGMRYSISDGDIKPLPNSFKLKIQSLYAQTLDTLGETNDSNRLEKMIREIEELPDDRRGAVLAGLEQQSAEGISQVMFGVLQQSPVVAQVAQKWAEFAMANKQYFQYAYDAVPGLFPGLVDPQMEYTPLKHVKSQHPIATDGGMTSDAPGNSYDYMQTMWGLFGNSVQPKALRFPNHALCCYIQALSSDPAVKDSADCGSDLFKSNRPSVEVSWVACSSPTWR